MIPTLTTVSPSAHSAAHEHFRRIRRDAFARRGFVAEERHVIRRDGRRLHLLTAGTGDVPTVLVHGGVGSAAEWADLAPLLTGRVVIVDTPGFGLSEPMASGVADWGSACAAWLLDLVDALGAPQMRLVGGSMGGYAAICFAAAHPDRVASLVLAGSAGGLFRDIGPFLRLWTIPGIGRAVAHLPLRDIDAVRTRMFGHYVADPSAIADDLLAVALRGVDLPGARARSRAVIRAVADVRGWKPAARAEGRLLEADVPTTFVWGDADVHAAPEVAEALAARLTDARVVVIPGAGHLPHLEHPAILAAALA